MFFPYDISMAGGRLIVADQQYNRVLIWNSIPTTNGVAADIVLGQNSFTTCTDNDDDQNGVADAGPTARTLWQPNSVWSDGTRLLVADSANVRLLLWNTFPTTSFQPADVVLGQAAFNTNATGTTDSTISRPWSVTSNGNQIFLADDTNNRVLIWNSFPTSDGVAADAVLGQTDFISSAGGTLANKFFSPQGVELTDDARIIISDEANHRTLIFQGN